MGSKIAVVTGAGRGLGRSMALHLARCGMGVVGTFRGENDDGFKSAVAEIEANGGRVAMLRLDVSLTADSPSFAADFSVQRGWTHWNSDCRSYSTETGTMPDRIIPRARAAPTDTSITRPLTNGPRSLMRHCME